MPTPALPAWACDEFEQHGAHGVCATCIARWRWMAVDADEQACPPRASFEKGWLRVEGRTHWYEARDTQVFVRRDGLRVLAISACGGLHDVTISHDAHPARICRKCLRFVCMRRHETEKPWWS